MCQCIDNINEYLLSIEFLIPEVSASSPQFGFSIAEYSKPFLNLGALVAILFLR